MDTQLITAPEQVTVLIHDIYTWRAHYSNGEHLDEMHAVHGFASVDLDRCASLALLNRIGEVDHTVNIPQGAHPVFFRRRAVAFSLIGESSEPRPTIHCIGWKKDDQVAHLFVMPDGSTLLTDNLQAV